VVSISTQLRRALEKRDALQNQLRQQDAHIKTLTRQWADANGLQAMPRIETLRTQL